MAIYIFERIDITGGGRGRFLELIRSSWARYAERRHGVRLVGSWATIGSTAWWPEASLLWEMDDWEHFAAASSAQNPLEEQDPYGDELWRQALAWRSGGSNMLLEPAAFSPSLAQIQAAGGIGTAVLYEQVQTQPGKMDAYHAALAAERVPQAQAAGLRLLGAYRHAIRPNVGLNLWALRDWDHVDAALRNELAFPGGDGWFKRCGELLEDYDGYLLAAPPAGRLGT